MKRVLVEECQKISISKLNLGSLKVLELQLGNQTIKLVQTSCNYGGHRHWFTCPNCQKRVGVFYKKPLSDSFYCRSCLDLVYELTRYRRSDLEQSLRQIHKLQAEFSFLKNK